MIFKNNYFDNSAQFGYIRHANNDSYPIEWTDLHLAHIADDFKPIASKGLNIQFKGWVDVLLFPFESTPAIHLQLTKSYTTLPSILLKINRFHCLQTIHPAGWLTLFQLKLVKF